MSRHDTTGGIIGLILAALCCAAAVFLFQAHAASGESAVFIAELSASPR